jgi:hypothetical protein
VTTRDMTRKGPRKPDSTGSSSSEETGPLKPPKDVLELGRHLVRELGIEDGVDTLGRWMAHHLAELIDKAENGTTAAERLRARKNATETILKIWEHRTSLPGNAYPLAPHKELLKVLDRLRPDDNPFRYFGLPAETKRDRLAADLFDGLSRLIIALLLMKVISNCDDRQNTGTEHGHGEVAKAGHCGPIAKNFQRYNSSIVTSKR